MRRTGSQRRVIVKHISDQEVERHIKVLGAKTRRKSTHKLTNNLAYVLLSDTSPVPKKKPVIEQNLSEDSDCEDISKDVLSSLDKILPRNQPEKSSSKYDDGPVVMVTDIYHFKTPKKAKQMTKFAMESAKKLRDSQKENAVPTPIKTPNSNLTIPVPKNDSIKVETPVKEKEETKESMKPLRKSKRIQKKFGVQEVLARVLENDDSDVSEDSEIDEDVEETDSKPALPTSKGHGLPSSSELYFEAHKSGGKLITSTSNRTMSRLKTPQIGFSDMQAILERIENTKLNEVKKIKGQKNISEETKMEMSRQRLLSRYRTYFEKWMFNVSHGFNLILFGFGSKRKLLHEFCQKMLQDFDKIIINGYFPSLLIKSILNSICDILDGVTIVHNNQQNQVDAICDAFSSDRGRHLFLIIHNIDGENLRNRKAQDIFCRLSQCPRIHIIATIDHINATLMWDQSMLIKFNWLWYDITSFEWYKDETSYENSLSLLTSGGGVGGSLALSGLLHVIRSLTPNARGIFKLIIERQMDDTKSDVPYLGVPFGDLYQMCREKFLVNSELTLRSQLTEFLDHKLIHIKKGIDGAENLTIPLDTATLKEYLEQSE